MKLDRSFLSVSITSDRVSMKCNDKLIARSKEIFLICAAQQFMIYYLISREPRWILFLFLLTSYPTARTTFPLLIAVDLRSGKVGRRARRGYESNDVVPYKEDLRSKIRTTVTHQLHAIQVDRF